MDDVRNKQRSKSANMKTLRSQMDLSLVPGARAGYQAKIDPRTQGLELNHPDKELFLNHKQF